MSKLHFISLLNSLALQHKNSQSAIIIKLYLYYFIKIKIFNIWIWIVHKCRNLNLKSTQMQISDPGVFIILIKLVLNTTYELGSSVQCWVDANLNSKHFEYEKSALQTNMFIQVLSYPIQFSLKCCHFTSKSSSNHLYAWACMLTKSFDFPLKWAYLHYLEMPTKFFV